jgi:Lrp/AsnC family leucine-responsive transcriptional regulator
LGYFAALNAQKLHKAHIAFVEVKLNDTRETTLKAFNERVRTIPAIEQCHLIAGRFDYLLKVRARNMAEYRDILGEQVSTLPGVAYTSTNAVMESVKEVFIAG